MTWEELEKYAISNGAYKIKEYGNLGFEFDLVHFFQNGTVEVIAPGPVENYSAYLGDFECPMSYEDMKTIMEILIRQHNKRIYNY